MRISTPTLQGKRVISSTPMMIGFQSHSSAVSTDVAAATIVQLEVITSSKGFGRFHIPGEDRVFRQRADEQPTCTIIPDAALFQRLVLRWRNERGATSSITRMAICPSYQRIIGMGENVIPLILRQLEDEGDDPDHWFWALQALTGKDPVPEDVRGDMREMARAWLDWAYTAGYDW